MPLSSTKFRTFYRRHNDRYRAAFGLSDEQAILGCLYAEAIARAWDLGPESMETIRLLDIGCGEGLTSQVLVQELIRRSPGTRLAVTGVDPCETSLRKYQDAMATKANVICDRLRIVEAGLEDFIDDSEAGSFDVVLCDHSLYCIELELINRLLEFLARPRMLALFALASRGAPVSILRRSQQVTTLHSEDLRRWLITKGYKFYTTRYHSEFRIFRTDQLRSIASWLEMTNVDDEEQAKATVSRVSPVGGSGACSLKNIGDVLAIFPKPLDAVGPLVALGGDLVAHEASRLPIEVTIEFVSGSSGRFQTELRGAAGFYECGVLILDPDKPALKNAWTHQYIFSCTSRSAADVESDTRNELRRRLQFVRSSGLVAGFEKSVTEGDLESAGSKDLENYRRRLIQMALVNSRPLELQDELEDQNRRSNVEKELGVLWVTGGEHILCSLLAVLRSGKLRRSWRRVATTAGFSSTPVDSRSVDFLPTKRFLRFVEWLADLFASEDQELPVAVAEAKQKLMDAGVPDCVRQLMLTPLRIAGKLFEQLVGKIWKAKPKTRAVPEICYIVSAGMRWECPNLLVFPVPRLGAGDAYAFITTIDLDELLGITCLKDSVDVDTLRLAKERIAALLQIFRQLFIRTELSLSSAAKRVWVSPVLVQSFYQVCEGAQYGDRFAEDARQLISRTLIEATKQIPPGHSGKAQFERVVANTWDLLLGDYAEVRRQAPIGDADQHVDVLLNIHQVVRRRGNEDIRKRLNATFGDRIPIDAKNYSEVRLGDIDQIVRYVKAMRGRARVGLLFYRGIPKISSSVHDHLQDKRNNGYELLVHGTQTLEKLLHLYAAGDEGRLLKFLCERPFRVS